MKDVVTGAVLAALVATGCGAVRPAAGRGTPGDAVDPCSLVSPVEAAAVLGARVEPARSRHETSTRCTYAEGGSVLEVAVATRRMTRAEFDAYRGEFAGVRTEPVSGVGDAAFWERSGADPSYGALGVLADRVATMVVLRVPGRDNAALRPLALDLAGPLVDRVRSG